MAMQELMKEQLSELREAAGVSQAFDNEISNATRIYRRAMLAFSSGDRADFFVSKFQRAVYYLRFVYGYTQVACAACNGSGYYDNDGSPDCGACDGEGTEFEPGPKAFPALRRKAQAPQNNMPNSRLWSSSS